MTIIIEMRTANKNESTYGIMFRSHYVYHMAGPRLHNPSAPHRLAVWNNAHRPNLTPDVYNPNSGKPGPGRFLTPDLKGTDDSLSYLFSAESTVITNNGSNTGTEASGQVYDPSPNTTLHINDFVVLRYPNNVLSDPFRIAPRSLADPILTPIT